MAYGVWITEPGDDEGEVFEFIAGKSGLTSEAIRDRIAARKPVFEGLDESMANEFRDELEDKGATAHVGAVPYEQYHVFGTVTLEGGTPVSDIAVEAFDGSDKLGSGTTDENGRYLITYDVIPRNTSKLTLSVKALDGDEVVSESSHVDAPERSEQIDLVVGDIRTEDAQNGFADTVRFVTVRPPEAVSSTQQVSTAPPHRSALAAKLRDAKANGREEMVKVAGEYLEGNDYVSDVDDLDMDVETLRSVLTRTHESYAALRTALETELEQALDELVESPAFRRDRMRVGESLLTDQIVPSPDPNNDLESLVQLFEMTSRLAADEYEANEPYVPDDTFGLVVTFSEEIFPLPSISRDEEPATERPSEPSDERIAELEEELRTLRRAKENVTDLVEMDLGTMLQVEEIDPDLESEDVGVSETANAFRFAPDVREELSDEFEEITDRYGIDFRRNGISNIVSKLEQKEAELGAEILSLKSESFTEFVLLNGTYVEQGVFAGDFSARHLDDLLIEASEPRISPLGFGELNVVRQQTEQYQLGEIAHIENVLTGETKERTHRRTRSTEETFLTESESAEEQERDVQTTDRFELQRLAQQTAEERTNLEAGVNVSASYGPTIQVGLNFNYTHQRSKQEAKQTSVSFARETVDRTVNRIQKRTFERRARKEVEEVEERNEHSIDNSNRNDHVSGIYRWVNKRYRSQVYQYGQRLLFEFLVPEPAAFYLQTHTENPGANLTVEKPSPPTSNGNPLSPKDLHEENYTYYAQKYAVPDISPPPKYFRYVSETKGQRSTEFSDFYSSFKIPVPDGYEAIRAIAGLPAAWRYQPGSLTGWTIAGNLQGQSLIHGVPYNGISDIPLSAISDDVPVVFAALGTYGYAFSVHLICRRTPRLFEEWQLEAYKSIWQAYQRQKAEYEEQLRAASVQGGIEISGNNPSENREIERTELKKSAISILRDEHLDVGAIKQVTDFPDIDFDKLRQHRDTIQFFEQSFEWPQLSYVFYPYFWARRKERWAALQKIEDADPLFAQFLRAGAARVVVPARPGYEQDILWYLQSCLLPITQRSREKPTQLRGETKKLVRKQSLFLANHGSFADPSP